MINPETIEIEGKDGEKRQFIISDIPYMSGGREICSQFVSSAAPRIGDYKLNEELSRKMFCYIGVDVGGQTLPLKTADLINNYVPDFQTGVKLEAAMIEKNLGFSVAGKIQEYQQKCIAGLPALITKMATLLQQSLQQKD